MFRLFNFGLRVNKQNQGKQGSGKQSRSRRPDSKLSPLTFERMEDRRLLAAFTGTDNNDVFTLTYSSADVRVTLASDGGATNVLGSYPLTESLTINGLNGVDLIKMIGTSGNDTIQVSSASVKFNSGAALTRSGVEYLTLVGGAGNDTYRLDADNPFEYVTVDENAGGVDTIDFSQTTTTGVSINLGNTTTQSVAPNIGLHLGFTSNKIENAIGGLGNDTLIGNALNNTLTGNGGNDTLSGGTGNDVLLGGNGDDWYLFGAAATAEADTVTEWRGGGTDTLSFYALATSVNVNLGKAATQTAHVNRTLKLNSAETFENLVGGSADDILSGNKLNNLLSGSGGNDFLSGFGGNDAMFGGLGNDAYIFTSAVTAESDTVIEAENAGKDTLNFVQLNVPVSLTMSSAAIQSVHLNRSLKLNSTSAFENAIGGSANDILIGNAAANSLTGNNGHDVLVGMQGNDVLKGGIGRDILIGGWGADKLEGGSEDDILIAGHTTHDSKAANLNLIRNVWTSTTQTYNTRMNAIRFGIGNPPIWLRAKINVYTDVMSNPHADTLTGGDGIDWYFAGGGDTISDWVTSEKIDYL